MNGFDRVPPAGQTPREGDHGVWSPLQGLPSRLSRRARWLRALLLGLLVGLLVGILQVGSRFDGTETSTLDLRIQQRASLGIFPPPIGPIAIVAMDDSTCDGYGGCPVPRADTARVIDRLHAAGARLIALDQLFLYAAPGTTELAAAMKRAGNVVITSATTVNCPLQIACKMHVEHPLQPIANAALAVGSANIHCVDESTPYDTKSIRYYDLACSTPGQNIQSLALTVLQQLRPRQAAQWTNNTVQLNFTEDLPQYSYNQLLTTPQCIQGGVRLHCPDVGQSTDFWDTLRGRIVFLGRTDKGTIDVFPDIISKSNKLPGVKLQAIAFNTIYNDIPIVSPAPGLSFLLTVALAMLLAALATALSLRAGLGLGLLALAGYNLLAFLALAVGNLWLPVVAPEIAMASSFLLVLGARYTLEERDQRRTRLLFSRFVPPTVVDELVSNSLRYGAGERRAIAVIFTDIRGFTTLSEHTSPEVVMGALRTYFTRMVGIVLEHGGTVDKYIGDGLMCLFGAPTEMPHPCMAALRTALAMQIALADLNKTLAEPLGTELRIGVGINFGEAVFGLSGAPSKLEFTAIGDTVNTASRLESLARDKGCGIVVSESVFEQLPEETQRSMRDLGIVSVKGRQSSVHIYGLDAVVTDLLRAQPAAPAMAH